MTENCVKCNKQLGLVKWKPKKEWNIEGKLCTDCFKALSSGKPIQTENERAEARQQAEDAHTQERIDKALEEGKLIFDPEATDEELMQDIMESQFDVMRQEAGTGWFKAGALLSGSNAERMIVQGFKALIDQNKIIIRQNELVLRRLKRGTSAEQINP